MGTARPLLSRFRHAVQYPARFFSSAPDLIRRRWTYFKQDSDESDEESAVYKRALRLQRPSSIKFQEALRNSVSLIGTIERPLRQFNKFDRFGAFTVLRVDSSAGTYGGFRVSLKFWDEMAQMSMEYLKPSDFVYVSGNLSSYVKDDEDGKKIRDYEVIVTEVNFITQHNPEPASHDPVNSQPRASFEELKQKGRDRLHLWQIFFASPFEWWDNRHCKTKPNSPDFKHKDTGEALWFKETDPPWVKQQLQLLDSRMTRLRPEDHRYRGRPKLTKFVYDDDTKEA